MNANTQRFCRLAKIRPTPTLKTQFETGEAAANSPEFARGAKWAADLMHELLERNKKMEWWDARAAIYTVLEDR